jgi:glutathione S-transferase
MSGLCMLVFAPMIDSELARLLLHYYGLAYREERRLFGLVSVLAILRGGTPQVPLVYGGGVRLAGPRAIVSRYDPDCPAGRRLVPAGEPAATGVEADWDRFNGRLATETAAFAYFHLLSRPDILIEPLCQGLPASEARALRRWAYPPFRRGLSLLLRLSPARAADALVRIRSAFDYTDRILADGRRYIRGHELTLGDFALVSAVAALLQPPGYGGPVVPAEVLPAAMASVVAELSGGRPTAGYVRRIYGEHAPLG